MSLHPEWQNAARKSLKNVLQHAPGVAVFDADGTLWPHDAGDAFFHFLLRGNHLPRHPYQEAEKQTNSFEHPVWLEYLHRCAINTIDGYFYITAVMAGIPEVRLKALAQEFVKRELQGKIFEAQLQLFEALKHAGHKLWIVSASNRWLIEAAAPLLALSPEYICAMDAVVENGILTDQAKGPIVQGQGKMDIIMMRIGQKPLLAVGNSHGDAAMMQAADFAVVIDSEHRSKNWLAYIQLKDWPLQSLHKLV